MDKVVLQYLIFIKNESSEKKDKNGKNYVLKVKL